MRLRLLTPRDLPLLTRLKPIKMEDNKLCAKDGLVEALEIKAAVLLALWFMRMQSYLWVNLPCQHAPPQVWVVGILEIKLNAAHLP